MEKRAKKGDKGDTGAQGIQGIQGEKGDKGDKGDTGDDYVLTQADKQEIAGLVDTPVDDVQINGTSIVNDGVAEIPRASNAEKGVIGIADSNGISITDIGNLTINRAVESVIKPGTNNYRPIVPRYQHISVFYGLATAAGDSTQSASSNPVGTYTTQAKTAIRTMLGIDTASLVAEIRNALNL